jgi:transposase
VPGDGSAVWGERFERGEVVAARSGHRERGGLLDGRASPARPGQRTRLGVGAAGRETGPDIEQFLIPTLQPGDIVVMDNLGSHKRQVIRRLIRAAGAKLFFLPPYSPDLNPIEQVFAKLKTLLRKADERTVEATWRRIGSLLDCFTPAECANYLKNSGYASP